MPHLTRGWPRHSGSFFSFKYCSFWECEAHFGRHHFPYSSPSSVHVTTCMLVVWPRWMIRRQWSLSSFIYYVLWIYASSTFFRWGNYRYTTWKTISIYFRLRRPFHYIDGSYFSPQGQACINSGGWAGDLMDSSLRSRPPMITALFSQVARWEHPLLQLGSFTYRFEQVHRWFWCRYKLCGTTNLGYVIRAGSRTDTYEEL